MFHEGQFEGRKVRPPVFLGRRPDEPVDEDLQRFSLKLMQAVNHPVFRAGEWRLCDRTGWADNASFQNLLAWCWRKDQERYVIVVNLSDWPSQGEVRVPWADLAGAKWRLTDELSDASYERDGGQMLSPGLYVDLRPWGCHLFNLLQADSK